MIPAYPLATGAMTRALENAASIVAGVAERGRREHTDAIWIWPRGSMESTLLLLLRSLQKDVDLPTVEPDNPPGLEPA